MSFFDCIYINVLIGSLSTNIIRSKLLRYSYYARCGGRGPHTGDAEPLKSTS